MVLNSLSRTNNLLILTTYDFDMLHKVAGTISLTGPTIRQLLYTNDFYFLKVGALFANDVRPGNPGTEEATSLTRLRLPNNPSSDIDYAT